VHYNNDCESQLRDCHLFNAQTGVSISDTANVLHGPILIVRAHDVVHLGEGVSRSEALLIKIDRSLSHAKEKLSSDILNQRLTAEDPLGHVHRVIVFDAVVRTGAYSKQVRGNYGGLLEDVETDFIPLVKVYKVLNPKPF